MVSITFFGAAGGVTGSRHLLEIGKKRILLDCGFFQGLPDMRERNRSLPFKPESIDALVLSHAHLDHSGMIPLLVKRGFTGNIFATPATKDVARHMLEDAAAIEEQDTSYRTRHHVDAPDFREPLFTKEDVAEAMGKFIEVPYMRHQDTWHDIAEGIQLKMYDAGHILGSAISVIKYQDGQEIKHLAYTGDMGALDTPLLHDPEVPKESIGTLIMESTYGSKIHENIETALTRLAKVINDVCERRGKMIVPAFSLGRTQMLVYLIHKLTDEGKIPRLPIYVDSPLATDITNVYRDHQHDYDEQTQKDFEGEDHRPLAFRNLAYTRSVGESKALNEKPGPYLVISASGMMTAGRVVHHLRHSIEDPKNAIFITGFQAEGTTGRVILEGAPKVELYGDTFRVRAQVELFNEFSAHADANQLEAYASRLKGLERIFLVHGEPHQADDLKQQLTSKNPEWNVVRPREGDIFSL